MTPSTVTDGYNLFLVYCRELAPSTVSLTGDRAQGDDSKHDSHYSCCCFLFCFCLIVLLLLFFVFCFFVFFLLNVSLY